MRGNSRNTFDCHLNVHFLFNFYDFYEPYLNYENRIEDMFVLFNTHILRFRSWNLLKLQHCLNGYIFWDWSEFLICDFSMIARAYGFHHALALISC